MDNSYKREIPASASSRLKIFKARTVLSMRAALHRLNSFSFPFVRKSFSLDIPHAISSVRSVFIPVQRYLLQLVLYAMIIVSICSMTASGVKYLLGMLEDQMIAMGNKVTQSASLEQPGLGALKIASANEDRD